MTQPDPSRRDRLVDLLGRGQWLSPGDVAVVLGCARRTVKNMLDDGRLAWRLHPSGSRRLADPQSVLAALRAQGETHRGRTARVPGDHAPDAREPKATPVVP